MDDRYLVSQRWVYRERRDQGEILVGLVARKNLAARCLLYWAVSQHMKLALRK